MIETKFNKNGFSVHAKIETKRDLDEMKYFTVSVEVCRFGYSLALETLPVVGTEATAIAAIEGLVDRTMCIMQQRYTLQMAMPDAACMVG